LTGGSFPRAKLVPRATSLLLVLSAICLPAFADDPPSLQDLIKGTAPPLKVDDKDTALPGQVDAQASTLPAVLPPAQPTPAVPPPPPPPDKKHGKAKPLEGNVQSQEFNSSADENGEMLQGQTGAMDKDGRPLNGNTSNRDLNAGVSQDPDMEDQDVMVEWDKWHNRVLNAIQQGLIEQMNATGDNVMFYDPRTGRMRSKYPLGTMAMFSCQVTPDHHIVNLKIETPSGYPDYDRAVYQAVKVLEGSSILRYPKNSHRKIVFEAAGIKTSMQAGPANFHWGDTEHYRTPGGGY
jgi:hypothetical protein